MSASTQYNVWNLQPNKWNHVFWRFGITPWSTIHFHSYDGTHFLWMIRGAGVPFEVKGGPQSVLNAPLGWGGGYAELFINPSSTLAGGLLVASGLIA